VTAIQPCALLLLVGPDWRVETISANAGQLGRGTPDTLLGRPLAQLIGSDAIHALRNRMSWLSGDDGVVHDYGVRWQGSDTTLDIQARREGDDFLIEAEPSVEARLPDGIGMAQSLMDRIIGQDFRDIAEQGVRQLCAITGYSRLMLCARDGTIVASGHRNGIPPLHEPSWPDLPEHPEIVADRDAEPVQLVGDIASDLLERSAFLAPGETQVSHLKELGIGATMSLPVRIDGELVGSVHAHHASPRRSGAERRAVAMLFAERLAARMTRHGWQAGGKV
jgi:light-regulated signal transduction histidine kinase (bacteriophytochrome)